ncbi:probable inactive receptor-like protein kinase At3g56050 isoform X2 [Cajanus cajan]|uniref:probable inactive receptor-like protein kinase At3g56050 isoform X1 n=1 Tax=Cajanus cajan TaxID=3821 RepID=UPI00098D9DE0|nr:probable inactive receptor-like protein kinase At3g56050 isoform X1 [Cajanus cajan]XP_020228191.1 probable inactive receptor-like protein kinase At3g56050 isoform X2 [Cajanus cajan]
MSKNWKFSFRDPGGVLFLLALCLLFQNFGSCCSLNEEGKVLLKFKHRIVKDPFGALLSWVDDEVAVSPCNWFGVECSDGRVVVLNLKDLSLKGDLVPELANLVHIKSLILRNNSFYGVIPEGIAHLNELEVLDLSYNNFSGPLSTDLGNNVSLTILLLDNNDQVDENQLSSANKEPACTRSVTRHVGQNRKGPRRLLQSPTRDSPYNRATIFPDSPAPSPSAPSPDSAMPPAVQTPASPDRNNSASPSPLPEPEGSLPKSKSNKSNNHSVVILAGVIGGAVFLFISIIVLYLCKTNKVATVKPWATGLSGQLQKAFVTGVPKLKRSELEAACEDFSNVIGTSSIGTVYKGTLSSGVEIAVASVAVKSSKDWSKTSESEFRKKIDTLSKVNHKNYVNLLGHCEEDEPFTRMMVFEYAPNGTLFEHLHIKEAEHLDWVTRLRAAMGMAYCLQHLHQMDPPLTLSNLNSSSVQLTDDYAAKIADLSFSNEIASAVIKSTAGKHTDTTLACNVYSFGVILLEMVTGRLPYSVNNDGSLDDWASRYLQGDQPLREMVDPTLASFQEQQVEQVAALIKSCVHPDQKQRPTMKEVCVRLREITKITPEAATPKLSPLWWAELEISSVDAS